MYYYAAGRFSFYVAVFAPLYAIIGVAAGIFNNIDIFQLGMVCTIIYTLISSIIILILFNGRIDKAVGFALINTFFNFIMFKYIAPLIILVA
jgi:hypothetical protein